MYHSAPALVISALPTCLLQAVKFKEFKWKCLNENQFTALGQSVWKEGEIKVSRLERREKGKILYKVKGIFDISFFNIKSTVLGITN